MATNHKLALIRRWAHPLWQCDSLVVLVIILASAATYSPILSYWFTGVDIFPLILSNRVESVWEIPRLLTSEHISAYTGQEIAAAVGIRPLVQLLFAIDFWIWNLNPLGFHLTNLLLHALNSVLIYFLVRQLRFRFWRPIGLLAALVFVVQPINAAIVPMMEARFDLLLGTFVFLSLIAALRFLESERTYWLLLAVLSGVLALGAKETAVILLPIMAFTAVYVKSDRNIRTTLLLTISYALMVIAYMVYRNWVLGGELGAYEIAEPDYYQQFRQSAMIFFNPSLFFLLPLYEGSLRLIPWRLVQVATLSLLLITGVGATYFLLGQYQKLGPRLHERLTGPLKPLILVSCWLTAFFLFYTFIKLLMGVFQIWYMYTPIAFFSIALSAATVYLIVLLRRSLASPMKSLKKSAAIGILTAPVVLILLSPFVGVIIFRTFTEWSAASQLGNTYLAEVNNSASSFPDGSTIFLINLPHGVNCDRPICVGLAYGFEDYSVDSWVKLTMPDRDLEFIAVSTIWIDANENTINSTSLYDPVGDVIEVQTTGGRMELPWQSRYGDFLSVAIDIDEQNQTRKATIVITDEEIREGKGYYFFDFFGTPKAFEIRGDALREPRPGNRPGIPPPT